MNERKKYTSKFRSRKVERDELSKTLWTARAFRNGSCCLILARWRRTNKSSEKIRTRSRVVFRYSNGRLITRRQGARDKDDAPVEDAALRVADNAERRSLLFTYTTLHTHTHTHTRCMHGRDGVRVHVHVTAVVIIGAANINEMIMGPRGFEKPRRDACSREGNLPYTPRDFDGKLKTGVLDTLMVTTHEDNVRQ